MITLSNIFLSIGLLLDIIGVIIMFLNSPRVEYGPVMYHKNEQEALNKKARKYHRNTKVGLIILSSGFTLQFVALFLK